MGYIDRVSKDLFNYKPELTKKEDFDSFWEETLNISKKIPLNSTKCKFDYPSPYVDVFKITYDGFDETKIHGWYLHPKVSNENKTPCLIHYHGFKGNKGVPSDFLHWIMLGIAVYQLTVENKVEILGIMYNIQVEVCRVW